MDKNLIGLDIGGTKCAITYGVNRNENIVLKDKIMFNTTDVNQTIERIINEISVMMSKHKLNHINTTAIGISCGGPLDSKQGIVMSPPNLPGWNNIPIVDIISKKFKVPVFIQNDANACALAEWKFGAAKGFNNVIFLTFGTGMGAGLILNGRLYTGTNDMAGEVGHIRLERFGPVGFGKAGSFEGFCSGSGIAQLARVKVLERLQVGESVSFCKSFNELEQLTAKNVAQAALNGDKLAIDIFEISGYYLGHALSNMIDILNPEIIVIGSIYARVRQLLDTAIYKVIEQEALEYSRSVCSIVPVGLGENIGDYAALSVAQYYFE